MKCILRVRLGQTGGFSDATAARVPARSARALLFGLAAAVVAGALAHAAGRAREDRRYATTGPARWIWWSNALERPDPIHFRAVKSFALPKPPAGARARVFGDGQWTLRINGKTLGSGEQAPGDRLVALDASPLVRAGENRIVLEIRNTRGAGGILFALDLDGRSNAVVSDGSWRVALSEPEADAGLGGPAMVWGKPPMHPWGFP